MYNSYTLYQADHIRSAREQREEDVPGRRAGGGLRVAMAFAGAPPGQRAAEGPAGGARRVFRPVLPGQPGRPPPQLRQAGSVPLTGLLQGARRVLATCPFAPLRAQVRAKPRVGPHEPRRRAREPAGRRDRG